ncbi:V-type ATP synthase subunit A [Oryzomonas rubra]|uniref:V-type ATP synthase subunit A n=1 Tax=Oryzomonas rubra TaxID=2509454 RepID=A0A5A9X813_9BACT|nr:V-type ATP synthase subunit A [Oryzomonas rubra]KAA0889110.1 V-type ATP synthase subunit A [Oryzomonas rubra]
MDGRITGISGPTVTAKIGGVKLCDMVLVGHAGLVGEVVRLEGEQAVVQVYENTLGLGVGEPVVGTGGQLTVTLGPGLVSTMYDGLQRPLERVRAAVGPFIRPCRDIPPLDTAAEWRFEPDRKAGDEVGAGEVIGRIREGAFVHLITAPVPGRLGEVRSGRCTLAEPVARYENGSGIFALQKWPVRRPRPFRRKLPPVLPLVTGQRVIDFLFPLVRGGTAIFPGGFGTGKTILEQTIAKFADADLVVYVGCGERGNEMAELLEEFRTLKDQHTGASLLSRTIVVVNTSNMPVAAREASIYTAVTIAEYYRDLGLHVLLLADSISRWGEALREISSSLEEMPGEEGYPTYLSSRLAAFFERAGAVETLNGAIGSLTMILSVSPPGGDFSEPVTQACLRTTGVFLMLDAALAHSRHYPAINWAQSYSLYAAGVTGHFTAQVAPAWGEMQQRCRELLQREETLREVAEIVGAEGLQDGDRLLMMTTERIRNEFLCQNAYGDDAFCAPERTAAKMGAILALHDRAEAGLKQGLSLDEALAGGA